MNLPLVLLCIFAFLTVISAAGVLLFRNVLYAAFSLLITFLGVAALYVLAGADLLAVVQIVIYVGGVLVLLIFGIMLMQRSAGQGPVSGTGNRFIGLLAAGTLPDIGLNLMTTSVLPFEVAGILLLVALIGAAYIAGQK
jgi:NADH-quinone oxidoreductase subunit J